MQFIVSSVYNSDYDTIMNNYGHVLSDYQAKRVRDIDVGDDKVVIVLDFLADLINVKNRIEEPVIIEAPFKAGPDSIQYLTIYDGHME